MPGIERAGVQAVPVQGGVLTVELLGDHDLAAGQPGYAGSP